MFIGYSVRISDLHQCGARMRPNMVHSSVRRAYSPAQTQTGSASNMCIVPWRIRGEGMALDHLRRIHTHWHQMENAADDPREFLHGNGSDFDVHAGLDA